MLEPWASGSGLGLGLGSEVKRERPEDRRATGGRIRVENKLKAVKRGDEGREEGGKNLMEGLEGGWMDGEMDGKTGRWMNGQMGGW